MMQFINQTQSFFIALGSVATAFMALFTLYTLKQYQNKEKDDINRELVEDILQPIIKNLRDIRSTAQRDLRLSLPPWQRIKDDNRFVVSKLPLDTYKAVENLCQELRPIIDIGTNNIVKILPIIKDAIAAQTVPPTEIYIANLKDPQWGASANFRWNIKGVTHSVTFLNLLFLDQTLTEVIERSKKENSSDEIENPEFYFQAQTYPSLSPSVVDDILKVIKNDIERQPELKKYIDNIRSLTKKVGDLEEKLIILQEKLSAQK